MRGKLIIFVLVLAVAGIAVSWRFAGDPSLFESASIPASLRSFRELEDVPQHRGLTLPQEVRVALTNGLVPQIEIAIDGSYTVTADGAVAPVLRGTGLKSTITATSVFAWARPMARRQMTADATTTKPTSARAIHVRPRAGRRRLLMPVPTPGAGRCGRAGCERSRPRLPSPPGV